MPKRGGVDRTHEPSLVPKLVFTGIHGTIVVICFWLAYGSFDWPDAPRAIILAYVALLYFLRNTITLFALLQRKVEMSEGVGLTFFMALFEIGSLLLGAGALSGKTTPFGWLDWIAIGLVLFGSFLNTGSELQRRAWKKRADSKGRCYTGGLFAYSMHINYFGDSVMFTGWAILAVSLYAYIIPIFITLMFIFYHIPPLDAYLAERYGEEFKTYAKRTKKFVPFIY